MFLKRWSLLILILAGLFGFFYFHLYEYLTFTSLKQHRSWLLQLTEQHYLAAVLLYMAIYIVAVAVSVPGATILTLAGGFLFGVIFGTVYVVISATIGATLLFLAVRSALGEWLANKAEGWLKKMERGFQENAFNYLLVLRLVPLFPFWIVNIVPALLNIRLRTFISATFLGIVPGSLVYVAVGSGLSSLFAANQTPNLKIIFAPNILLPLIGLAVLAVLPILYKRYKQGKQ